MDESLRKKTLGLYEAIYTISDDVKENKPQRNLNVLQKELNIFFKEAKCKDVIYTDNSDKLFFGMCVMPVLNSDDTLKILQGNDNMRIESYYLEIDSKLFSPVLDLSDDEITAIVLHEVGHMVKDAKPIEEVRKSVDLYLAKTDTVLKITDSIHYKELLDYAIKDSLRKITSLFVVKDEEVIADEFAHHYGYGPHLESALRKINSSSFKINKDVDNKLIVMAWVFRLYTNVKMLRIPALKTLRKGESLTGSELEKTQLKALQIHLNRIDDEALIESVLDDIKNKLNSTISQIKYKGIRSLEDDLYEYNMRIRNVESEDDALLLLRQINSRLSIIDDYIHSEKLEGEELQRWFDVIEKFKKQREQLSTKMVYRQKASMINVTYPDITMKY